MDRKRIGDGIGLAVLAGSMLLASGAAAQQRTGVVLDFSGRGGGAARGAVVSALADHLELVAQDDFRARARQLGADLDSPAGMAQVAREMDVDVVVVGEVRGRRRRARVTIRMLDSAGNEVARRESGSPAGRRGRRGVGAAAVEALEEALSAIGPREREAAPDPEEDDVLGGGLDDGTLDEDLDEEPGEPAAVPYVEAMLGFGIRTRDAEITLDDGGTRGYQTDPFFPELSIRLVLRPFAGDDGAMRGLFAHLEGFHSVGLGSQDETTGEEFSTSALRVFGQVGYLHSLGTIEVGGGLGFGYDAFLLDENATMSSTKYTYLRPGLVGRFPLSGEVAQLQLDAGLRVGLGAGELTPMFAESASAFGWDLGAAFFGNLESGFAYALRLGYVSYGLSFEGDSSDPMVTPPAVDGSDSYVFVTVNAGYQLR